MISPFYLRLFIFLICSFACYFLIIILYLCQKDLNLWALPVWLINRLLQRQSLIRLFRNQNQQWHLLRQQSTWQTPDQLSLHLHLIKLLTLSTCFQSRVQAKIVQRQPLVLIMHGQVSNVCLILSNEFLPPFVWMVCPFFFLFFFWRGVGWFWLLW